MLFDAYVGMEPRAPRCWELVRHIYARELRIGLPARDTVDGPALLAQIGADTSGEMWREIEPGAERPFDVALMKGWYTVPGEDVPRSAECHVGVVTAKGFVLHCDPHRSSVIEPYGRRVKRFYRHKALV